MLDIAMFDTVCMCVCVCVYVCVCVQLLEKPKFRGVEKIKTIGSTYMAATGLNKAPDQGAKPVS